MCLPHHSPLPAPPQLLFGETQSPSSPSSHIPSNCQCCQMHYESVLLPTPPELPALKPYIHPVTRVNCSTRRCKPIIFGKFGSMWLSLPWPSACPASSETQTQRDREADTHTHTQRERERERIPKIGMVLTLPGSLHTLPTGGPPEQYNTN